MDIDRDTVLFFDASCLIAAAGSPTGGSAYVLSLCPRGLAKGAVSQPVLLEAERNIRSKLGPVVLSAYLRLVAVTPVSLVSLPSPSAGLRYQSIVGEKDEHVVAAAVAAGAIFLLTLDKKLETRVNEASLPIRAISPGEFIKSVLPQHADYVRDT